MSDAGLKSDDEGTRICAYGGLGRLAADARTGRLVHAGGLAVPDLQDADVNQVEGQALVAALTSIHEAKCQGLRRHQEAAQALTDSEWLEIQSHVHDSFMVSRT